MDKNSVCVITYVKNKNIYEECLFYLKNLKVPEKMSLEFLGITEAKSIAEAYNKAIMISKAKYKIYVDENAFIINRDLIRDIIGIFDKDDKIGIIGVEGRRLTLNSGVCVEEKVNIRNKYVVDNEKIYLDSVGEVNDNYEEVDTVTGGVLATQYDIRWRSDLFDGDYFYDVAQCKEFQRHKYKVVVLPQEKPWGTFIKRKLTDDYYKYENIYLREYEDIDEKKISLFFPELEDQHLTKDICLIPYIMKEYFGYNASFITTGGFREFPSNKKFLGDMSIYIGKDMEECMREISKSGVLMLIWLYQFNIDLINRYKEINPEGKVYIKLDAKMESMGYLNGYMNDYILNTLKKCDLISVENRNVQRYINSVWNLDVKYIPNGYYDFISNDYINYEEKKNIILFVGRVGSPEKANHILLEAFARIEDEIEDWSIELVGNVENNFLSYMEQYYINNPKLKERVRLIGFLDKKELKEKYKSAKVFCLTSPSEACANVFSQAMSNGCYLISTDVDGARDVTNDGEFGCIVPVNDIDKLSIVLKEICLNGNLLEKNCIKAQKYARKNLSWIKLCREIDNYLFNKGEFYSENEYE